MSTIKRFAAAFVLTGLAWTADAAPKQWTLDLGHAYVGWEIYHLGYSSTVGQFRKYDGRFLIDEETPENSRVTFTVDATSIDSNHMERDAHLNTQDYLDSESHPEITFVSKRVELLEPEAGLLHGDLTMLGVTKPITLKWRKVKDAAYPAFIPNYNEIRAVGFELEGEIYRLDYGMDFIGFVGSPTGLAVTLDIHFDLVDCDGMPDDNVPCTYGRR
ncbi:MAG: YceI family protein [Rhodobacteraceae bacterium]|nr:YceI family protein [Paracoccaceae bacterium]